jgi:hypothetical protein
MTESTMAVSVPITSPPAVISSQGVYCLVGHLATSQLSGPAISTIKNGTVRGFTYGVFLEGVGRPRAVWSVWPGQNLVACGSGERLQGWSTVIT